VQLCGCSCCWPCVFIPSCAQDAAAAAAAHGIVEVKKKNKKMRFLVSFSNFFSPCVIIVLLFFFFSVPAIFAARYEASIFISVYIIRYMAAGFYWRLQVLALQVAGPSCVRTLYSIRE
jgi:hypothetical protein